MEVCETTNKQYFGVLDNADFHEPEEEEMRDGGVGQDQGGYHLINLDLELK